MDVLVLVSGIADPKWPLPAAVDAASLRAHARQYAVPSPFDEAALELALRLRDADPATAVTAVVAGGEALARKVAGWRMQAVSRFDAGDVEPWDAGAYADALALALGDAGRGADLLLIGREFGDLDDGSVAPLLARRLGIAHVGLALAVELRDGVPWATRQRGPVLERLRLGGPALLSITNDARNRLRHPLLKNVMAARQLRIPAIGDPAIGWPGDGAAASGRGAAAGDTGVRLAAVAAAVAPAREGACRMLAGPAQAQADALARVLLETAEAP